MRRSLVITVIVCCGTIWLGRALAEDAKQVFDALYGQKIKAVTATISRDDDVVLAKDLLAAAKTSTDTPGLLSLMCEAIYDLGQRHVDGYGAAADAMTLLADVVEPKRDAARAKLVDILTRQSRLGKPDERDAATEKLIDTLMAFGDQKMDARKWDDAADDYRRAMLTAAAKKLPIAEEAKAKLEIAARHDRSAKQIARLMEKLLADANDSASAEEIVRLHVVEFDDPKSGLPLLNRVKDENLKRLVKLAAKPRSDLTGDEALELGQRYRALAATAEAAARVPLQRSADCLSQAVGTEGLSDLQIKKAQLLLNEVKAELAKLSAEPTRPTTAAAKPKSFNPAQWELRIWNGGKWDPKPLSKIEMGIRDQTAAIKNTDTTHGTVHLCIAKALAGDFAVEIKVSGASFVGLGSADGADVNYHLKFGPDARREWRTVRVERKDGKIVFKVDGEEVRYVDSISGNSTMKGYFYVGIERGETAQIRDFSLAQ